MEFNKRKAFGIIFALVIIAVDIIFLRSMKIFWFILGIAFVVAVLPFVLSVALEGRVQRENDEMFLEFSRNLVESVKSGTPISKSIINIKDKYYGTLTPHIKKLANQISLGISVQAALKNFAGDVNSKTISRAITLISEAERAGGNIEKILDAVAISVNETEKLKKERKNAIYNLAVQGYIIFLVFIVIMLIMQFKIVKMTVGISSMSGEGFGSFGKNALDSESLAKPFLFLLIVQGFFTGLTIGKLTEGNIKSGIKHSFIMIILALLISTGANVLFA